MHRINLGPVAPPRIPYLTKRGEQLVVVWVNPRTSYVERETVLMQAPTWWRGSEIRLPRQETVVEFCLFLEAATDGCDPETVVRVLPELDQLLRRVADLMDQTS